LVKPTFFEAKLTVRTRVDTLACPDPQLAAIHGLTALFVEASRIGRPGAF
jgi:hypothetical protein